MDDQLGGDGNGVNDDGGVDHGGEYDGDDEVEGGSNYDGDVGDYDDGCGDDGAVIMVEVMLKVIMVVIIW